MRKSNITFAILFSLLVVCTGCDLGTYNKRLNDRTPPVVEPEVEFRAMRQVIDGEEVTTTWEVKDGKVATKKVNGEVVESAETTLSEVESEVSDKHEADPDWKPTF